MSSIVVFNPSLQSLSTKYFGFIFFSLFDLNAILSKYRIYGGLDICDIIIAFI